MASLRYSRHALLGVLLGALSGCGYDTGKLGSIEPTDEEIDRLEVCDGVTIGALRVSDAIDDDCRAEVEPLLGDPTTNLSARLILLGTTTTDDRRARLFLLGVDSNGEPLSVDSWRTARLDVIHQDRTIVTVGSDQLEITPLAERGDALAVSVITDYSATMRDEDLDLLGAAQGDLIRALPAGFEAQVIRFSDQPVLAQDFTDDPALVIAALARDDASERGKTALHDAVGTAATNLSARERPIRLLVLATDGLDNASRDYRRVEANSLVSDHGIAGLLLGTLFADTKEMRRPFGDRGAYYQAPSMAEATPQLEGYVSALQSAVEVTLPEAFTDASAYTVRFGERELTVRR